jgi:hypothetical protein
MQGGEESRTSSARSRRCWRRRIGGVPKSGLFRRLPDRSGQQRDLLTRPKRAFMN